MKKTFGILSMLLLSILIAFTGCNKDQDDSLKDDSSYEIDLKSFEPEVSVKGGGEAGRYEKLIIEELIKNPDCNYEVVSGLVEFYYESEMVFAVDFGDGECDGLATITWIKEDGSTYSKVVDVWKVFRKKHGEHGPHQNKCFELVLPVDFIMPDGSSFIVAQVEDWAALRAWYQENPGYEEKPMMQFPVDIQFTEGELLTVNSKREMHRIRRACEGHHGHKITRVITEQLVRSEECDGEIVSGLIDFYDQEGIWVRSIDFGDGFCDGIATKCWINENLETECEDVDVANCMPRP